ncbi:hypothetical protein [Pseudarthrobacter sp. BIM B-2242]|uniref:hypothetical protein n=1 Tax=Pseudarthrobacter sp. BIM B-2242 TaxID=2772401 RepID=UPI00168A5D98|nr:hypothetical protein [Pseudarthrobacter sp. BIM B-2242]QOD05882.1 hypothetical protein IDT60_23115 [Pseudarthrobacter sp. BIM B-2242]
MELRRRPFLTDPGETLLLSESALDSALRLADWREATGLDLNRIVLDGLTAVPLPLYMATPPGPRQFSEVTPSMLWHPLFWLPPRLANRYAGLPTGEGGAPEVESNELWSIRVGLELAISGLYSEEEGWLDILSTLDIDVDDPADVARIAAWQAGSPDEVLDNIDLDQYLHLQGNPNWALESALSLLEPFTEAQWALRANSLIDMILEVTDPTARSGAKELRDTIGVAATLAGVQFAGLPDEDAAGFWAQIEDQAKNGLFPNQGSFMSGPVLEANSWLHRVRDAYWGTLDELQTLQTA